MREGQTLGQTILRIPLQTKAIRGSNPSKQLDWKQRMSIVAEGYWLIEHGCLSSTTKPHRWCWLRTTEALKQHNSSQEMIHHQACTAGSAFTDPPTSASFSVHTASHGWSAAATNTSTAFAFSNRATTTDSAPRCRCIFGWITTPTSRRLTKLRCPCRLRKYRSQPRKHSEDNSPSWGLITATGEQSVHMLAKGFR